jgi:hypothetical protein
MQDHGAHSNYFEPYWIATSEFTPDQFGLRPPAKIDIVSNVVTDNLNRKVATIEYLANGVFHTVFPFLCNIL